MGWIRSKNRRTWDKKTAATYCGRGGCDWAEAEWEAAKAIRRRRDLGGRLEVRDGLAGGGREELVKAVIGSADGFNVRARKSTQDRAVQLIFLVT